MAPKKNTEKPTEKAAETVSKKAGKDGVEKKKKHKKKDTTRYGAYIYKVLKQVHPNTGISRKAMNIMESLVEDIIDRLIHEAGTVCRSNARKTMSSKEVQAATLLLLKGELAKHGVSQGIKALTAYNTSLAQETKGKEAAPTPT